MMAETCGCGTLRIIATIPQLIEVPDETGSQRTNLIWKSRFLLEHEPRYQSLTNVPP